MPKPKGGLGRGLGSLIPQNLQTPEEAAATLKSEALKWSKVIRDAGIKAE